MSDTTKAQSLKNDIIRLQNQQKDLKEQARLLKIEVDSEVSKLERLRNEENHIDGELRALKVAKNDHENQKLDDAKKLQADRESTSVRVKACEDMVLLAKQTNIQAENTLKKSNDRVLLAQSIEKTNAEFRASIGVLQKKIEIAQSQLAEGTKRLDLKASNLERMIQCHDKLKSEALQEIKNVQEIRQSQQRELDKINKYRAENERILNESKNLKSEADKKFLDADEKSKASQLSVDRQWNQIEIEKKRLEMMTLRINKLIKDNDLEKELKDLKDKK